MESSCQALVVCVGAAVLGGVAPQAVAARDVVELVVTGEDARALSHTLTSLVRGADAAVVVGTAPGNASPPESADYVLTVDTEHGVVAVLRRSDEASFRTEFEPGVVDLYAAAVVAAELLEVARSGGDPRALGYVGTDESNAASTSGDRPNQSAPTGEAESEPTESTTALPPDAEADAPATELEAEAEVGGGTASRAGPMSAFTVGLGVELWGAIGGEGLFLLQPSLFVEFLVPVAGDFLVGVGVFASGLGEYTRSSDEVSLSYHRYDFGVRGSAGTDVGQLGTRLLAHLRIAGGVVVGSARTEMTVNPQTATATRMGWSLGGAVEIRQTLFRGLEVFLLGAVDVLPAPVDFVVGDDSVLFEGSVRIGGTLGLSWRLE